MLNQSLSKPKVMVLMGMDLIRWKRDWVGEEKIQELMLLLKSQKSHGKNKYDL